MQVPLKWMCFESLLEKDIKQMKQFMFGSSEQVEFRAPVKICVCVKVKSEILIALWLIISNHL